MNSIGKRAVVIGAGIGGLTAARVLADHFEQVVILERDALGAAPQPRPGTPQDRHAHAILAGGLRALNQLFPDFEQDLIEAGAVPLQAGLDLRMERPSYDPFPQRDFGWLTYGVSRPLIEFLVRNRAKQHANIELRERCRALALVAKESGDTVAGVDCEMTGGTRETLPADLVVDASGRGALTLDFLKSHGAQLPEESAMGVNVGYATALFEIPGDAPPGWKSIITFPKAPESSRGGIMFPCEGNRWILSTGGMHGDAAPGDFTGFLEFVRGLRTPTIYNAIRGAKRLGDIVRFRLPASIWRHFERLAFFPHGLVPFGDAICRFNPTYGQGMSVASQQACALARLLRTRATEADPLASLALAFLREAEPIIDTPWAMISFDLIYPETEGQRPPDFAKSLQFFQGLTRLAAEDANVHKLTWEVAHLLKPRSAYRDPDLVERVTAMMAEA